MSSWQEILDGIGNRTIDATEMTQDQINTFFSHLEDEEVGRISEEIAVATEEIDSERQLIATITNILSGIAGLGLKFVKL